MLRRPGREPKSWWRWWLGPRSDAQGRDADKPPGAVGGADDQHSQQHQVLAETSPRTCTLPTSINQAQFLGARTSRTSVVESSMYVHEEFY